MQVRPGPPIQECHQQIEQVEKKFTVAHGSDYRAYPSFASHNDSGAYPLAHDFRYPCQRLQIDANDVISLAFP